MPESKNDDSEIALAYSQKFWEAGNLIVIMMFTLAFAVYLALIQFCNARRYVAETDNFIILVVLAFVGNGALIYLLENYVGTKLKLSVRLSVSIYLLA